MTTEEITERQVTMVRKRTNLTAEQCSRQRIVEMLKNDYPRDVAAKLMIMSRPVHTHKQPPPTASDLGCHSHSNSVASGGCATDRKAERQIAYNESLLSLRACIHCHKAPAEVPDRNTMSLRKRVCIACHASLLRADLSATIRALQEREKGILANLAEQIITIVENNTKAPGMCAERIARYREIQKDIGNAASADFWANAAARSTR
jgi:hypothetical protein